MLDAGPPAASTPAPGAPLDGPADPTGSGRPHGDAVDGLLTFRANPTRGWHRPGPAPRDPAVGWRHPSTGGLSGVRDPRTGSVTWCGPVWTGRFAVFERRDRTGAARGVEDA